MFLLLNNMSIRAFVQHIMFRIIWQTRTKDPLNNLLLSQFNFIPLFRHSDIHLVTLLWEHFFACNIQNHSRVVCFGSLFISLGFLGWNKQSPVNSLKSKISKRHNLPYMYYSKNALFLDMLQTVIYNRVSMKHQLLVSVFGERGEREQRMSSFWRVPVKTFAVKECKERLRLTIPVTLSLLRARMCLLCAVPGSGQQYVLNRTNFLIMLGQTKNGILKKML